MPLRSTLLLTLQPGSTAAATAYPVSQTLSESASLVATAAKHE